MGYDISAKVIIVHYFKNNKAPLTYDMLRAIRCKIMCGTKECSFVDVSIPSLLSVVEQYPSVFKWNENRIELRDSSDEFFNDENVADTFDWQLTKSIKDVVVDAISSPK